MHAIIFLYVFNSSCESNPEEQIKYLSKENYARKKLKACKIGPMSIRKRMIAGTEKPRLG